MTSLFAVLIGTFTLRFSTGLTGLLLIYYFAALPSNGGPSVQATLVGVFNAAFFAVELVLSIPFGVLSDRWGHHRVMQFGPMFGAIAVVITYLSGNLFVLGLVAVGFVVIGATRLLEGASTAASVPSILGYIANVTAGDELARGRASARFEGATLAGLGAGLVAAGPLFQVIGTLAFLLNAVIYGVSLLIYRFGVHDEAAAATPARSDGGWRRYLEVLTSSHVWLLAPTWIALNASIAIFTSQSVFQLVNTPNPKFADQFLMGGFEPIEISVGLLAVGVVFFGGLAFWGERFKRIRRTTIITYGIGGGALIAVAVALLNHSAGQPWPLLVIYGIALAGGVFVLAGATPAAIGLLADITEAYPADRAAIMGLYSVFLAIGQIAGSLIGGVAADLRGIDGLLVVTMVMLGIALVPLSRLRAVEHLLGTDVAPAEGAI